MRTNVYRYPNPDDYYDQAEAQPELVGWYDPAKASSWGEGTRWDGNNHISLATNSQWDHQEISRTATGRWTINQWSQRQGVREREWFISEDEAKAWFIANEHSDETIAEAFGEAPAEESGPPIQLGRPRIGPRITLSLPTDMLTAIDERADAAGTTRPEWIRDAITAALGEQVAE